MSQVRVIIPQGALEGSTSSDIYGSPYYSFQGIPYAKPPLGELRFKAPLPPDKWQGTWNAIEERDGSYGRHLFKKHITGSEDCLYLNVFTKRLPNGNQSGLKPVMVWIHGGGFIFGPSCGDSYRPDFLITEDVVIVTVSYRLGLLGFLSLQDPSLNVPGNAAFKDMVMALKWVQSNIKHFNGDPNNVTIFGESAGAAAVHLLALSPVTKGLIHRAILQSGSALNSWAEGRQCAGEIAETLGLKGVDEKRLLEELMLLPVEKIFELQEKLPDIIAANFRRPIGYVVENEANGSAFLWEKPLDIIQSGKFNEIPLMIGYTSAEGILFEFFRDDRNSSLNLDFEVHVPYLLGYKTGSEESKAVAEKIKNFYYGDKETLSKRIKLTSDNMLVYLPYVAMKNHIRFYKSPVYLYKMTVESSLNFFKLLTGVKEPGASHCDDLGYLFKNFATPEIKPGSLEDVAMKRFVRLWANFARLGNPTPGEKDSLLAVSWKPAQRNIIKFLDIGKNLVVGVNPDTQNVAFWDEIFADSPLGSQYVSI